MVIDYENQTGTKVYQPLDMGWRRHKDGDPRQKKSVLKSISTERTAFSSPLIKPFSSRSFLFPNHKKELINSI